MNELLKLQNSNIVANTIRQTRTVHKDYTILVVEGPTDHRLFENLVKEDSCKVFSGNGKIEAIKILTILENDGVEGILAIVDSDFDKLSEKKNSSKNLFQTDTHDLESMLIKSRAFEKMLRDYFDRDELNRIRVKFKDSLKEILMKLAKNLGLARYFSHLNCDCLNFRILNSMEFLETVLDIENLEINLEKLIKRLIKDSIEYKKDSESLIIEINKLNESKDFDLWLLCQGHDLVNILTIILNRIIEEIKPRDRNAKKRLCCHDLERSLRLSYEFKHFSGTKLFHHLKLWEMNNKKYRIISNS